MNDMEYPIVLPDSLVAKLVDEASTLSRRLATDFTAMTKQREQLRNAMKQERRILVPAINKARRVEMYTIDGAHILEVDRATAYSLSCVVRLGNATATNDYSTALAVLPHTPSAHSLSTGLMGMQEIMTAVRTVESHPQSICCIDGSKISALIAVNQFYSGITQDLPGQIEHWRAQAQQHPESQPGKVIKEFESRNWVSPYLANERIIGNLKLVTTTQLVDTYASDWSGRYDDKALASLILEPGEIITPQGLPPPPNPYHISNAYPYAEDVHETEKFLYMAANPGQILHLYYRPDSPHGVYKIEFIRRFLSDQDAFGSLLRWWAEGLPTPDIHEPYQLYITDLMAKQAVSKAKEALREIARKDSGPSSWAWFFTEPYRTEKPR